MHSFNFQVNAKGPSKKPVRKQNDTTAIQEKAPTKQQSIDKQKGPKQSKVAAPKITARKIGSKRTTATTKPKVIHSQHS